VQNVVVVIDVCHRSGRGLWDAYQDFGVRCATSSVQCALLKAGDEDASAHYALVDVLRTLVLIAEVPLRLRLAILTSSEPVARVGKAMGNELRVLGCEARVFRDESEAGLWLTSPTAAGAAPRAGCGIAGV
jgi:hypothetical protein